ncbi:MAG: hypothetical protein EOO14_04955 [Chitinophagaceae bacterium]|nr:MAG: hypothetical protein EOO14_04955 [Chitinophagaceae bacterium]
MKPIIALSCLLLSGLCSHAQVMSPQFNHLKKYMGINVIGGYARQSFKHESLNRFAASFNSVFASSLSTQLSIPQQFEGPVAGAEISAGIFRIGYTRKFNQPMKFEAQHTNGSIRKMEIETPKNNGYFDLLMPFAKGRVFAGMTVGADFGYFRLRSYLQNNFGRDTYANGDGVSGIFQSHLDLQGRFGGRLDINLVKRVSISLRAETYNTVINASETALNGWKDEFYSDATLSNVQERRVHLAEDVRQRHNNYITLGNALWETTPAVYGQPKGMVYSVTANVLLVSFNKKNK